ncbi:MAG: hypothetical protein KHX56_12425 [Clostridiales bacterium]|nr:hypothetical protein [Clostridiales bacterium]
MNKKVELKNKVVLPVSRAYNDSVKRYFEEQRFMMNGYIIKKTESEKMIIMVWIFIGIGIYMLLMLILSGLIWSSRKRISLVAYIVLVILLILLHLVNDYQCSYLNKRSIAIGDLALSHTALLYKIKGSITFFMLILSAPLRVKPKARIFSNILMGIVTVVTEISAVQLYQLIHS